MCCCFACDGHPHNFVTLSKGFYTHRCNKSKQRTTMMSADDKMTRMKEALKRKRSEADARTNVETDADTNVETDADAFHNHLAQAQNHKLDLLGEAIEKDRRETRKCINKPSLKKNDKDYGDLLQALEASNDTVDNLLELANQFALEILTKNAKVKFDAISGRYAKAKADKV